MLSLYCFFPFSHSAIMEVAAYLPNTEDLVWVFTLFNMASACEDMELHPRISGAGCVLDNSISLLAVEEHECVLHCLAHKTCKAVNYDVQNKVCVRIETPCPVVETQLHVNYQILAIVPVDECVRWVATHDWNYPRIVKVNQNVGGDYPLGVARLTSGGDTLPAKWPNNIFLFEVLAVNEACSLRWVYYDASRSDPLPTGAIQGGHWSDGTPLYVALVYASADRHVVGYYNYATRMGTCDYNGENNKQDIELLIVT